MRNASALGQKSRIAPLLPAFPAYYITAKPAMNPETAVTLALEVILTKKSLQYSMYVTTGSAMNYKYSTSVDAKHHGTSLSE